MIKLSCVAVNEGKRIHEEKQDEHKEKEVVSTQFQEQLTQWRRSRQTEGKTAAAAALLLSLSRFLLFSPGFALEMVCPSL